MNATDRQPDAVHAMVDHYSRWTVCAALLLFAVTWQLWTPQTVFPQMPFFAVGLQVPGWVDWLLFGVTITSLIVALIRWQRAALAVFAISATVLILLDQHRLQPWAYQFVLIAVVLATADNRRAAFWLRVLIVSLYFHSALSKFDASFLNSHGQELVGAAVGVLGIEFDALSESVRKSLAFSLPLTEMLVAIGLCVPRCRRAAVIGSVVMHLLLFLALGPWGLKHKPGVLIWNVFFIGQNLLLFWSTGESQTSNVEGKEARDTSSLAAARFRLSLAAFVITAATILPFLEPFGWFDHWPAWGLYNAKSERVAVFVHVLHRDRLPPDIREFTATGVKGPVVPRGLRPLVAKDAQRADLSAGPIPSWRGVGDRRTVITGGCHSRGRRNGSRTPYRPPEIKSVARRECIEASNIPIHSEYRIALSAAAV